MGRLTNHLASILPPLTLVFPPFPIHKFIAQGGDRMKKIAVVLFIVAATVMVCVVPALAGIGGW